MKYVKLFTEKEDSIIIECLIKHRNFLKAGFEDAHRALPDKTLASIKSRYYQYIRKEKPIAGKTNFFTPEQDNILIECIKQHPTNISHGIRVAAEKLNRTTGTLTIRYYGVLRKDINVKAITCGSSRGFTQNVKNIARDKDGNMPEQHLRGYMWLMREMLDLTPEDRKKIINFFK